MRRDTRWIPWGRQDAGFWATFARMIRASAVAWRLVPWLVMPLAAGVVGFSVWRGITFAPPGEEPTVLAPAPGGGADLQRQVQAIARAPLFGKEKAKPVAKPRPVAPDKLPPARVDARLVGVVTGSLAAAILAVHGRQGVYWIGDEILPGVRLVEVGADYAIVERGGRRERLLLSEKRKAAAPAAPMARAPQPRAAPVAPRRPAVPRIQRRRIPRPWLRNQLAHLPEILRQARVVPRYQNGKFAGFMITNIVPGSVYEKIGLQNGDVIKAVNGVVVKTPQQAMQMYEKLRDASRISVKIERAGTEMTLDYQMH